MTDPVNLTNLRELIGDDKELEKELFIQFISAAEDLIKQLELSKDKAGWYNNSHAFKGIAINLGAEKLGEICKKSQDKSESTSEEKAVILQEIKNEYTSVKNFLNSL